jgi:hypothetical protein
MCILLFLLVIYLIFKKYIFENLTPSEILDTASVLIKDIESEKSVIINSYNENNKKLINKQSNELSTAIKNKISLNKIT